MERLLIHAENQTLLWNLIRQCPLWNEFSGVFPGKQETWFRQCIADRYDALVSTPPPADNPPLPKNEWLLRQNKETIQYMMADLRRLLGKPAPTMASPIQKQAAPPLFPGISESTTLAYTSAREYDKPAISAFDLEQERKAKHERAKQQFDQFRTEYNTLFQTSTPKTPVFSEQIEEQKLTTQSMDELLKWQQDMRERDIGLVGPPPAKATATSATATNPNKIAILPKDERESIKHEIIELISAQQDSGVKKVSWASEPAAQSSTPVHAVFEM
jgi:hypothetical protein